MGFIEKSQIRFEEENTKFGFLIGKYFKYKERYDDPDFTFVKTVEISPNGGMICDSFFIGDLFEYNITAERTIYNFNEIQNMTEIPKEEFYYEIKKLLDIMNLELKK